MDSRNGVTINFNQELYRWIVEMVNKSKSDPLNYSNSTFGGFVQSCVAKAKIEYEAKENNSDIKKGICPHVALEKRIIELEKQVERINELENQLKEMKSKN